MRNKTIFFSFLIACIGIGAANCQQRITQATYPDDVTKTIVREYSYPSTISYIETKTDHYFAYADATMTIVNTSIGTDISVLDFAIHDSYLYFCGIEHSGGPKGVWGWFKVSELFSGSLNMYTQDVYVCGNYYVDTLHSLVLNTERDSIHIALVGNVSDGVSRRACMMEIVGMESVPTGWRYQIGVSSNDGEYLDHICLTNNLVVGAGVTANECCSETYRVHWRWNMFASWGPQDVINSFNGPGHHKYDHAWRNFAMTHVDGDTIAVGTFYGDINSGKQGLMVNTYNMNDVALGNYTTSIYSSLVNLFSPPVFSGSTIQGLRYGGHSGTYSLLLSGNLPSYGTGSHLVEFNQGIATVNISSLTGVSLNSIDNYNSGLSFVTLGFDMVTSINAKFLTQPFWYTGSCVPYYTIITNSSIFARKHRDAPYTVCADDFDCSIRIFKKKMDLENEIICSGR